MWHHLTNTQYFSEAALQFKKNGGRYTMAPRGSREYFEYWALQEKRCKEGYKVGDVWITGRHYFYLNFTIMQRLKEGGNAKTGQKITDFPRFTEMQYEWWRFKHIAWNGGTFMGINSPGGKHICCGKTRRAGFSYMEAADGFYNYTFIDGSKSFYFASREDYLTKDGILNKVNDNIDWINTHSTKWMKNRHEKSTLLHQRATFRDEAGNIRGSKSEIMGVIVDDPNKAHPYSTNILTTKGRKKWKDVVIGDKVFGVDGKPTTVLGCYEQGEQDIYTLTFNDGRKVQATIDHLWSVVYWHNKQKNGKITREEHTKVLTTKELIEKLKYPNTRTTNQLKVRIGGAVQYEEKPVPIDAYTIGLMLGDGSIGKSTETLTYITMMDTDISTITKFIPYKVEKELKGRNTDHKIRIPNGRTLFKELNLFDKRSGTKFIPNIYKFNCEKVRLDVLNGLLDTDGSVTKDFGVIEYCSKSPWLSDDFVWLARSLGFGASKKSRVIDGTTYYRCYLYCKPGELRLFNLDRKKNLICTKKYNKKALNKSSYIQIDSIEYSHREQAKCIKVSALDSLYLVEDFITTHNTRGKSGMKITFEEAGSFKKLKQALEISMGSIIDGARYVGQATVFGTGGEEGASLEGLEDIFYDPHKWNMLEFPNVWESGETSTCGYFVPCYRTNLDFIDKDGNSDEAGAVAFDETQRELKRGSKDPRDLDRRKAEFPQIPSEMFNRLTNNGFNIHEIDQQIKRVLSSSQIQGLLRYGMFTRSNRERSLGGVEFLPEIKEVAKPIELYPHPQSTGYDLSGCVTIVEPPYIDQNGKVPPGMYQLVFDAYYKDDAEDKTSLFDFRVFKLDNSTDSSSYNLPVAWFTGRPARLSTCHEQLFMMCDYYNCTAQGELGGGGQGVVDYAKQKKLLHRVEFEPEMLHNKEIASKQKNRSYLMNMTTDRKRLGMTYLEQWHMEQRGVDDDMQPIYNVHRIYDIGLLRELRRGGISNSDRMSACLIAMFMLKENVAKTVKANKTKNSFYERTLFATESSSQEYTSLY